MYRYILFFILSFLLSLNTILQAQDLQYSQYFNAPLFLNPAYAGTADNTRMIFNYRTQWRGLNKPYTTYSASFDHMIEPIKTGVGVLVRRDLQGDSRLNSTEVGLIGSYYIPLSTFWSCMPAVQTSWFSRSLNYDNFTFGDQIDINDPSNKKMTGDKMAIDQKTNFLDFSAGGVLFSDLMWIAVTVNHLNRPDQAFQGPSDRIPLKSSVNVGYKFYFEDPTIQRNYKEKSLIPTVLYKSQGKYDQLDLGIYGIYDPFMVGMWYRGLPLKRYGPDYKNHDAIVLMGGINLGLLAVAYSYDKTISGLHKYSRGAHEITVLFEFYKPYKVKRKTRDLPCPKFYGQKRPMLNH